MPKVECGTKKLAIIAAIRLRVVLPPQVLDKLCVFVFLVSMHCLVRLGIKHLKPPSPTPLVVQK